MQHAELLLENLGISGPEPSVKEKLAKYEKISRLNAFSTQHDIICGDSGCMESIQDESAHLVVTSPPYFDLVRYRSCDGQLGHLAGYEEFLTQLDRVWAECQRILIPGGRLCIVVGDVCRSRRRNGKHEVIPLHSDILVRLHSMGFEGLATVFWFKIANASREISGKGGFLGKPYEPNGVIKNDVEYILRLRKPGPYRKPTPIQRTGSLIPPKEYFAAMRQVWTDIPGASRRNGHPAPFPASLAARLIRISSYVEDVVVDPFLGTGTTVEAAHLLHRSSIGYEIDPEYVKLANRRLQNAKAKSANLRLFPK